MRVVLSYILGLALGSAPGLVLVSAAESVSREPAFVENFYSVKIRGPRAWVAGYYGTILYSGDRGATWEIQKSGTQDALFVIDFASDEAAWIVGSYGMILRTQDGGKTWTKLKSPTEEQLFSAAFVNPRDGWVVGSRGTILQTSDGGASWRNRSIPDDIILNRVAFASPRRGWIVGEFGVIYQTIDGGQTWAKQKSPIEVSFVSGESRNLFELILPDGKNGWAFGLDGVILKTRNGDQWTVIHPDDAAPKKTADRHLFAAAASHGSLWAVGERGTVIVSQIGKDDWHSSGFKFPPLALSGIDFAPDGFGLIVGARGAIFRTVDGGRNWQRIRILPQAPGKGVAQVR